MVDWTALLVAVGVPEVSGALIGIVTSKNIKTWYDKLNKPSFCPPDWLFGVVWPILYALIGISSYMIYEEGGIKAQQIPLLVYAANLLFNNVWSLIFFGAHHILLALIDIVLVDVTAVAAFVLFYPVNNTAAYLLIPYIAWVLFASALNFAFWRLNPDNGKKNTAN